MMLRMKKKALPRSGPKIECKKSILIGKIKSANIFNKSNNVYKAFRTNVCRKAIKWNAFCLYRPEKSLHFLVNNPVTSLHIFLKKIEFEAGLRVEYVDVQYNVNPEHRTYKSDGYNYMQPFPNLRLAFKINDRNKISIFYNRRVDRPAEVDIRIFPKYDDAEILKVGNPALNPQFTNSFELGYKTTWKSGYFYSALYHRISEGTITRIATTVPGSTIIYSIMQNAGKSYNTGVELVFTQDLKKWLTFNLSVNGYENIIEGFTVENKYPVTHNFTATRQQQYSGNIKCNGNFHLRKQFDIQVTSIYLAPDIIPQGKIGQRYSLDIGVKKGIQKGKGEVFLNATDILNTMVIRKEIKGEGFKLISLDYYETQVIRIGYNYKF